MRERGVVYQWSFWVQAEMDRRDWQKVWRGRDPSQINLDPAEHDLPALTAWLKRCTSRDSWAKVRDFP